MNLRRNKQGKLPVRINMVFLFILGSMFVMFVDGLYFDQYITRPAMAMMHMEMKPTLYMDPSPPNLEEYWAKYRQFPTSESDPDVDMEPEIIWEDGKQIKRYHIEMKNVLHEIRPGVKTPMYSFNNKIPGDTIRIQEGDEVQVVFTNKGTDPHTIHWHGINALREPGSDGAPGTSSDYIYPGETWVYNFTATETGTKMYHCHVEAPHHMAMGMYGAIIVEPKEDPHESPFKEYADNGTMVFDGAPDMERIIFFSEIDVKHAHVAMPADMMAMGPDGQLPWLNPSPKFMMPFDPDFDEYMINGKAFPATKFFDVKEGDIVRMRIINMGHKSHTLHIHGHTWTVTHRDGHKLAAPFQADTLLVGGGERYDGWFVADNPGVWPMHDHQGSETVKGYDPGGILTVIRYEGADTTYLDELLKRIDVYTEYIEHMDEDHGMLTPTTPGMGMMQAMEMGGMDMDGGH